MARKPAPLCQQDPPASASSWINRRHKPAGLVPPSQNQHHCRRKYTETERYRELPKENSKGSASKRNNEQMGLHQTTEILHSKGNSHHIQETSHCMGENLCQLIIP
jgi:hypothetical protein